ncbi:MAG: hypothetical protein B7Z37_11490 [Verrucomicrobia bacterium 12-59-8]|nr:MAG: hypothetical protein B7Z37_11490 [Verrucomicrobia bacterium 12-59-8]
MWGSAFDKNSADHLTVMLGPLLMDRFLAGYGAIYSDVSGTIPGFENLPPDDRWIHIVYLTCRASLILGDLSISLNPFLYYLPNTGRVGWAIPGPLAGTGLISQFGTTAFSQINWYKELGRWKVSAYDQFSPFAVGGSLFNVFGGASAGWGDLSPIDRVGRYAVGYGTGDVTNYGSRSSYGGPQTPHSGVAGIYNIAGVRAFRNIGDRTMAMFYLDRFDLWDSEFNHTRASLLGGAYLKNGDQFFSSYVGYNFMTAAPWTSAFNWAVAGVKKRLTQSLLTYAEAGYYWQSGDENAKVGKGWTALAGIQQQLGLYTNHRVEAGRRVYLPVRSSPGVENFVQYGISHRLRQRNVLSANVGITERHVISSVENDSVLKYAAVSLTTFITPRLSAITLAGWEHVEFEQSQFIQDSWQCRLSLLYALTRDIQAQAIYQYQDVHGTNHYSEHYIYLGASKSF